MAWSRLDPEGLRRWAKGNDLTENLLDDSTPLGKLYDRACQVGDKAFTVDLIPEFGGRFCYRSWGKGRDSREYIENIKESGHGSVLEHSTISLAIEGVSRSLTHELVRHRAGFAVSQESQRYVDAKTIKFVVPPMLLRIWGNLENQWAYDWMARMDDCIRQYIIDQELVCDVLQEEGYKPLKARKLANEAARANLPNAAETKLLWTGNLRALRHVLELRGSNGADLEIKRLQGAILMEVARVSPEVFFDIETAEIHADDFGIPHIDVRWSKV